MKKVNNTGPNLVISHVADIDGMGGAILAKILEPNISIVLVEVNELTSFLNELSLDDKYKQYETIYIIDLPIRNDGIELLQSLPNFNQRIVHYDHHTSELKSDMPSFMNVIPEKDGKLTSGTSLFLYEYLLKKHPNNEHLNSSYTKDLVEQIRSYDTWDWAKDNNMKARKLNNLFAIIGAERFIEKYYKEAITTKEDEFNFSKEDEFLLDLEEEKIKNYIEECDKNAVEVELLDYKALAVVSESYRSYVGNVLSKKYQNEYAFILIIDLMRRSFSFRTVHEDVNVGSIAKLISKGAGGGQPKAGGMPINENTNWVLLEYFEKLSRKIAINNFEEQKNLLKK
jgi:uncharacterized protein